MHNFRIARRSGGIAEIVSVRLPEPTAPEWQRESAPASEMLLVEGLHALVQFMPSALREEGSRAL